MQTISKMWPISQGAGCRLLIFIYVVCLMLCLHNVDIRMTYYQVCATTLPNIITKCFKPGLFYYPVKSAHEIF